MKEGLPYTIYSSTQFFNRKEIKDALSYLRMIAYRDDLSFLRIVNVLKRNLGKRRVTFLQSYAEQAGGTLYDALRQTLDIDPPLLTFTREPQEELIQEARTHIEASTRALLENNDTLTFPIGT